MRVVSLARRVANSGRVVPDDQHRLMAQVLKLAHLAEDDAVAQMDVRGGGVHAQLDAELAAGGELGAEFLGAVDGLDAAGKDFQMAVSTSLMTFG